MRRCEYRGGSPRHCCAVQPFPHNRCMSVFLLTAAPQPCFTNTRNYAPRYKSPQPARTPLIIHPFISEIKSVRKRTRRFLPAFAIFACIASTHRFWSASTPKFVSSQPASCSPCPVFTSQNHPPLPPPTVSVTHGCRCRNSGPFALYVKLM